MPAGIINGLATMIYASSQVLFQLVHQIFNYHIQLNSQAKDKAIGSSLTYDNDDQNRPYNIVSDLGADEYWPFHLSANAGEGNIVLDWTVGSSVLEGGVGSYKIVVTCLEGANPPNEGICGNSYQRWSCNNLCTDWA